MNTVLKLKHCLFLFAVLLMIGCGGGGGDSTTDDAGTDDSNPVGSSNGESDGDGTLVHVKTYELPCRYDDGNYLLDGDKLILAGGQTGSPAGEMHLGHLAFSDKIYVIDLTNETQTSYTISALADPDAGATVAEGLGNDAIIKKLSDGTYLIYGGFQYNVNTFILDLDESSVQTYQVDTVFSYIDDSTHYSNTFHPNLAGCAAFDDGGFAFFGLAITGCGRGAPGILRFNPDTLSYYAADAELSLGRYNTDAYDLNDGSALIVGGWDGTGAQRRAEIYDPVTDTIKRVADFPSPISSGQHGWSSVENVNDDGVCVEDISTFEIYQYSISDDTWSEGCAIEDSGDSGDDYVLPDDYSNSYFIGKTSDGKLIYSDYGGDLDSFSSDCNCYPYIDTAKIYVFTTE